MVKQLINSDPCCLLVTEEAVRSCCL